jgi:hypothetical protein
VTETNLGPEPTGRRNASRLSAIVVLLLLIVLAQGWQIVSGMRVKSQSWEYLIEGPADDQLQARLKTLGTEGWELVSARRATTERGGRTEGIYEMIFRRPGSTAGNMLPVGPTTRQ